jgi:hypothetical protein
VTRLPSAAARWLEPFASGLWIFFLVWSGAVAAVWWSGFGEAELSATVRNKDLHSALQWLLRGIDPVWFALAAATLYLALAEAEGIAVARRGVALLLAVSFLIAACSAATTLPLGPVHYTARLGTKLGPAPLGWLMLWVAVVLGARGLAQRVWLRASHLQLAAATAVLAALTAANLEPIAWKMRAFWLWYPADLHPPALPPLQNSVTWLVAAFGLAFVIRGRQVGVASRDTESRAALVFLLLNGVFLGTHVGRLIRN